MNKQKVMDELYGNTGVIDAELFNEDDINVLKTFLKLFIDNSNVLWFKNKTFSDYREIFINSYKEVLKNMETVNLMLYYTAKVAPIVMSKETNGNIKHMFLFYYIIMNNIKKIIERYKHRKSNDNNVKLITVDNINLIFDSYDFYIAVHIAKQMVRESYQSILNSNLKWREKSKCLNKIIKNFGCYKHETYGVLKLIEGKMNEMEVFTNGEYNNLIMNYLKWCDKITTLVNYDRLYDLIEWEKYAKQNKIYEEILYEFGEYLNFRFLIDRTLKIVDKNEQSNPDL